MTDYIKREDLLNALNAQRIEYNAAVNETIIKLPSADVVPKSIYEQTKWERDFAEKRADDMSKLIRNKDVVEVVRCKDCRHRIYDESRNMYYCEMYYGMGSVRDNNYCNYGERADE